MQPLGGGGGRNGGVGGGDGGGGDGDGGGGDGEGGGGEGDGDGAGAVELAGEGVVNVGAEVTVIPKKELAAEVEPSVVARAFVTPEAVEPTGTAMTAVMITEPAATWTTTKDGGT